MVIKLLMDALTSWPLLMITFKKFGHIHWKWRIRCSIYSSNFTSLLKGRLDESWSAYGRTMGVNTEILAKNIVNRMTSDWRRWCLRCHSRMGLLRDWIEWSARGSGACALMPNYRRYFGKRHWWLRSTSLIFLLPILLRVIHHREYG